MKNVSSLQQQMQVVDSLQNKPHFEKLQILKNKGNDPNVSKFVSLNEYELLYNKQKQEDD